MENQENTPEATDHLAYEHSLEAGEVVNLDTGEIVEPECEGETEPEEHLTRHMGDTVRTLSVDLAAEELEKLSKELPMLVRDIQQIKQDAKSAAANFKSQADIAEARQNRVLSLLESKRDMRDVRCEWVADFRAGFKRLYREDTGEQIDQMPLTDKERQMKLTV